VAADKLGLDRAVLAAQLPRVAEIPFDSHRRRMTTVHRMPDGGTLALCKGAPESVLDRGLLVDPEALLARAVEQAHALSQQGFRVLAVAGADHRPTPGEPSVVEHLAGEDRAATVEQGLRLLGLVALADPPKPAAGRTVEALLDAGIVPVLITGDHVATALAMARRVGIASTADAAVSGLELDDGSAPDLTRTRVFARTTPPTSWPWCAPGSRPGRSSP
jgi:Ca2+-transporting ATPase